MVKKNGWLRRLNSKLHLWLGLSVGLLIVIISLTGCIYVFERDIRDLTESYRFIPIENKTLLPPTALASIAHKKTGLYPAGVQYGTPGEAAAVTYTKKGQGFTYLYINPYSGAVIREKILNRDFFRIVLAGHYYLWLPPKIGQPLVCITVIIFVFLLISGLIMWWPKRWNRANRKKSFSISWKARFKRLNYDLHNVLGFYVMLFACMIAITGLVFGFKWFKKGYYYIITAGKQITVKEKPLSDTTFRFTATEPDSAINIIWKQMMQEYQPVKGTLQISLPVKNADPVAVTYNPERRTYYKRIFRYFDRYTGKELPAPPVSGSTGDKIYRMNYDLHVGAAFGMTGKIIAFAASLVCASLPVTGFMIWRGRRKKIKTGQNEPK